MGSGRKCGLCKRQFGLMLWEHKCNICNATVCDDCAPKHDGIRQCSNCASNNNNNNKTNNNNIDNEAEREKRLRAVEERLQAANNRGSHNTVKPRKVEESVNIKKNSEETLQKQKEQNEKEKENTEEESRGNPMLEAAMRRRQQEQYAANAIRGNSVEKTQLLTEIVALLKKRGEEEPFGLRSMDEAKLRGYLRYIKSKEKSNATLD